MEAIELLRIQHEVTSQRDPEKRRAGIDQAYVGPDTAARIGAPRTHSTQSSCDVRDLYTAAERANGLVSLRQSGEWSPGKSASPVRAGLEDRPADFGAPAALVFGVSRAHKEVLPERAIDGQGVLGDVGT